MRHKSVIFSTATIIYIGTITGGNYRYKKINKYFFSYFKNIINDTAIIFRNYDFSFMPIPPNGKRNSAKNIRALKMYNMYLYYL